MLVEQLGYEVLIEEHFTSPPTAIGDVYGNQGFLDALASRIDDAIPQNAEHLLKKLSLTHEPTTILDIGCGLGMIDLGLFLCLKNRPQLYLLDGASDREAEGVNYASGDFKQGYRFTFNLSATHEFLTKNGVPQENISFIAPSQQAIANLKQIELVISLTSWGWHYPLDVYWEAVKKVLSKDSILFVDIRKNYVAFLEENFREVEIDERKNRFQVICRGPAWL